MKIVNADTTPSDTAAAKMATAAATAATTAITIMLLASLARH
jgi:hypothetical protein